MEENATMQETNAEELDLSGAFEEYNDTEESAAESAPQQEEWGLDVVFNGEKKTLTRDEAVAFTQKGMNYDHVKEELDRLRAAETTRQADTDALNLMDKVAQGMGMDRLGYLNFLQEQQHEAELQKLMDEGHSRAYAEERLKERQERLQEKKELEEIRQELKEYREKEARREQWSKFFANHTDIESFDALPDDVKRDIAAGEEPEAAYMRWENKSLKEQLAQQKQATKNAETSVGSAKGDGAGDADTFLAALLAAAQSQ